MARTSLSFFGPWPGLAGSFPAEIVGLVVEVVEVAVGLESVRIVGVVFEELGLEWGEVDSPDTAVVSAEAEER